MTTKTASSISGFGCEYNGLKKRAVVIVRFVHNLQLRPNFRFELTVCLCSIIFGIVACAEFTRKDYIPENILVLTLGLMPFVALAYDTMNGFTLENTHLPLFNNNNDCGKQYYNLGLAKDWPMWRNIKNHFDDNPLIKKRRGRRQQNLCDIEKCEHSQKITPTEKNFGTIFVP